MIPQWVWAVISMLSIGLFIAGIVLCIHLSNKARDKKELDEQKQKVAIKTTAEKMVKDDNVNNVKDKMHTFVSIAADLVDKLGVVSLVFWSISAITIIIVGCAIKNYWLLLALLPIIMGAVISYMVLAVISNRFREKNYLKDIE